MKRFFVVWTLVMLFLAAAIPLTLATEPDVVVAAAGDICGRDLTAAARCTQTSDLILGRAPERVLTLGDNQYQKGELVKFQTIYDPNWGRFKGITIPSPGNHDKYPVSGYDDYFGVPNWYSTDVGGWHLVSLDSNKALRVGQQKWFRTNLETDTRRCEIAYWHHPLHSTEENNPKSQPLWDIAAANSVDLVLSGHAHMYERFAPVGTIREFVVGTGGASLRVPVGPPAVGSEHIETSKLGVLFLTLRDPADDTTDDYSWEFVQPDGTVLDSGSDNCE